MHITKRIALLAVVAAAAVPAQASAATDASGTQAITADVAATLEVSSWAGAADFSFGTTLTPGVLAESGDQTFTVKSNAGWGVNLYDADADSAGKLTKYSAGAFVPATKMVNPLQFEVVSVGGTATGDDYADVPSSAGTAEYTTVDVTGDLGQAVVTKFAQMPSYSDPNLGATDDYRIVVTYNVDQAL
jgi:hypothetical protein